LVCSPSVSVPQDVCVAAALGLCRLRLFLRFRMGCHDLRSDAGRRQGVPRSQRVCSPCSLGEDGEERQLVFTCPALEHIRSRYRLLFGPWTFTMFKSYGRRTWFLSLGSSRIVSISCGVRILHLISPRWLDPITRHQYLSGFRARFLSHAYLIHDHDLRQTREESLTPVMVGPSINPSSTYKP
jgi:hypothetical protein